MRTLFEILEDAKDGNMPSHEECFYAMLAVDGLRYFDAKALRDMVQNPSSPFNTPAFQEGESVKRKKAAFDKSPQEWLGDTGDPASSKYQAIRNFGKKALDKFEKEGHL
jgi:hypothetical protein